MNTHPNPDACPVCTASGAHHFFSQKGVPIQCGRLASNREEALRAPTGDIELCHCRTCSHVWNASFDPAKIGFDPEYDLSLYHSQRYRDYVAGAIERLKTRYHLEGKTAVDIGCGKGDFMRMLIAQGFSHAIGFDPTFIDSHLSAADHQHITVHKRFFGPNERTLRPDLVTCRSALQYVANPREFLSSVRTALEGAHDTVVCFEVLNGAEAFRERIVWYVTYEAGCFFSAASLARLFRECGFQVLDVLPALGDAYWEIEARPARDPIPSAEESAEQIGQVARDIEGFAEEYASQVARWSERFEQFAAAGTRVVLWGAGMRAISLLTSVPAASACIEHAVDVNTRRQGRFLPRSGQQVIAPEELPAMHPDLVIATHPHYADEIRGQMRALGLDCDFLVLR
jgi:2-polyprenyl-3-methyl-5-hydroxy-6-metoxy-1,4-benzoquinol methylase